MQSHITKQLLSVAYRLGAASTLAAAQFEFTALREKPVNVWTARLSGGHLSDAIDVGLTFADTQLVEIRIRATAWDPAEAAQAWNNLRDQMTQRYGPSKSNKFRNGNEVRKWPEVGDESVMIEKRFSEESSRPLMQIILVRRYNQPHAAERGTPSLFDLFEGEVPSSPLPAFPRGKRPVMPAKALVPARRTSTWTSYSSDPPEEFIFKGGPHKPKWPNGRPRPSPYNPLSTGPLFFSQSGNVDAGQLSARLAALHAGLDALLRSSEWKPFYQVDEHGLRHHSSRWWWLGGGSMLHVFVRESSSEGAKPSIVVHAYHDLDCPSDQAVLAAPTVTQIQGLLDKASRLATASAEVSA